jgi:hypothetical protein
VLIRGSFDAFNPVQASFGVPQLTFPNPDDVPPCPPQGAIDDPVTLFVPLDFTSPPSRAVRRPRRVLRTAMPETTVHKYHRPLFSENKVGTDGELRVEC